MVSGKMARRDDDVLVGCLSAWDGVATLLGASDGGDVSAEKAKGQFFGETSKTFTSLRAIARGGEMAQAKNSKGLTAARAGGEVNVSDEPTL